jgi:sulfite exporter TauE/SafE
MKAIPRIKTVSRHSLPRRIFRAMERSWLPAILVYAFIFAAIAAASFPE